MKKFGLRIFSLVIALVVAVVLTGCVIQQGTKIEFSQLPAGVYTTETGSINLNNVTIKVNNKELTLAEAKDEYNVTITGDSWTTYGDYTLVVILDGAAITFKYSVKESIVEISYDTTWDGQGTEESPWLIQNEEELKGLAAVVNGKAQNVNGVAVADKSFSEKYFKLTSNIELAPGWEPIGATNRKEKVNFNYFAGNFDGNNKVIFGLTNVGYNPVEAAGDYSNSSTLGSVEEGYVYGLFGAVSGAEIKNVVLENVYTEDISLVIENQVVSFRSDSVGAVVGYVACTNNNGLAEFDTNVTVVENCHVISGEINGYDATAGIVGRAYGSTSIKNCSNAADISCDILGSGKSGGIIAIISSSGAYVVENCSNAGNIVVENAQYVGGVIGWLASTSCTLTESGNTNTGRLFALNPKTGAVEEFFVIGTCAADPTKWDIENPELWKKLIK